MNSRTVYFRPAALLLAIVVSAFVGGAWVAAQAAAPAITNLTLVGGTPQFRIQSDLGITNQIQYATNLGQTNWTVLTNVVVTNSPYLFVDVAAPPAPYRFYRVAALYQTNNPTPPGMALIPAGSFTMGDSVDGNDSGFGDATPISVTVSAFYMDVNLVSSNQWRVVYSYATNHGYGFVNAGLGKSGNHPVYAVGWYGCVKWCNARSVQAGLAPVYYTDAGFAHVYTNGEPTTLYPNWGVSGYRLPTEAEWEKAARGGLSGRRFPRGNTISQSQANYIGATTQPWDFGPNGYNAIGNYPTDSDGTSPVGSFPANGYGLYDMVGNVEQWCWDWYETPYAGGTNPRGPVGPLSGRVFRGGDWNSYPYYGRCAYRNSFDPNDAGYYHGFRCVRGL